jgi:hypothetical protein
LQFEFGVLGFSGFGVLTCGGFEVLVNLLCSLVFAPVLPAKLVSPNFGFEKL